MINAIHVCALHSVTYHVPGVVVTSRGAYSCKAAPNLGETKLFFSMRVHDGSQDALTIHLSVGVFSSNCTHFLHFYQPFNICTYIWVTRGVCFLYYSLFEVWAASFDNTLHRRGCGTGCRFVHDTPYLGG